MSQVPTIRQKHDEQIQLRWKPARGFDALSQVPTIRQKHDEQIQLRDLASGSRSDNE